MNANENDVFKLVEYPMCDYILWADNSLCDCPTPCTEILYDVQTSIANWPKPPNQLAFYDKYIKPNPQIYGNQFDAYGELEAQSGNMTTEEIVNQIESINLIPKNFIQLKVRFLTENYRRNDDLPAVGWETLFSNLGGTLNLWMGITVLFAAVVAEFVFHVISIYFVKVVELEATRSHNHEHPIDTVSGRADGLGQIQWQKDFIDRKSNTSLKSIGSEEK